MPRPYLGRILVLVAFLGCASTGLQAQEEPANLPAAGELPATTSLRFRFEKTPWKDVIKWLSEEAQLALHMDDLPTGSFTYSDPREYTHDEAVDRVNLFLLAQGYTLVRSGQLLSVINLRDSRSVQQLEILAKLIDAKQLTTLSDHNVVKCIFSLGDIKAEDAASELEALKLMTAPVVFAKTNRLMITDTVAKLKSVKLILDAFEPSQLDNGTVMKNFPLQHVEAEDILIVARPHLGLATGEMIGIDVSVSADIQGKNIFVTGTNDKVKLIEGLVNSLDKPQDELTTSGDAQLKSYVIPGGNVETVYNVLQTLLADKPVRLSMDSKANSIVALASAEVQQEIHQTVEQLQVAESKFEIIPLKTVDPFFAISLLEQMLDLPDPLLDDPEDIDASDAPKIDADPGNMRLFVRGKPHQIERIKQIVAELDSASGLTSTDETIRVFPLHGPEAERAVRMAARFWREDNLVIWFPASLENSESPSSQMERVVGEEASPEPAAPRIGREDRRGPTNGEVLAGNIQEKADEIRCQPTPRGLLLHSDDKPALDQFIEFLQTIAGPVNSQPTVPVVFYLKYTKAADAVKMLAELLDGGELAGVSEGGTLVNGYVGSAGDSALGSLLTTRAGTTTMTAGTMSVVADSRLNRLIAQGTESDIAMVEDYLQIIDKDTSLTDVQTYGKSHVIELKHTRAHEVATVIREAFAGRVAGAGARPSGQPSSSPKPQQQPNPQATSNKGDGEAGKKDSSKKNPPQKPNNASSSSMEPRMTVAVHPSSNSIIVTAPDQLFAEVEKLVRTIDVGSEQKIEVISTSNTAQVFSQLQKILGNQSTTTRTGSPSPRPSTRYTPPTRFSPPSAAQGARR